MNDIRKLLDIINETTTGATASGGVAPVSQSMHTQRRVEEDYTEESSDKPQMPQILEYGNWENSALTTSKKLKKSRKKASKIVKSVYGEDMSGEKKEVTEGSQLARTARKIIPGVGRMQAKMRADHEREQGRLAMSELPGRERKETEPDDEYWSTRAMGNRHYDRAKKFDKIASGVDENVTETKVGNYKDLGATSDTTHFIKNVTTGKIVSPHRSRQDAEDALIANKQNSNDEFKIVRARKEGVAEGLSEAISSGNYSVGLEDIGKRVTVNGDTGGKTGYVLVSIRYTPRGSGLEAGIVDRKNGSTSWYDLTDISKSNDQNLGEQDVTESFNKEAEAWRDWQLKMLPRKMEMLSKLVKGWVPSEEDHIAAIKAGYDAMIKTGNVNDAAKAISDTFKEIQRRQDVAEGLEDKTAQQRKTERDKQRTAPAQKARNAAQRRGLSQDKDGTYYAKEGVAEGLNKTPKITFAQQTPGSNTRLDILVDGVVKFQAVKTMGPGHWFIYTLDNPHTNIGDGTNKTELKIAVLDYLSKQSVAEGQSGKPIKPGATFKFPNHWNKADVIYQFLRKKNAVVNVGYSYDTKKWTVTDSRPATDADIKQWSTINGGLPTVNEQGVAEGSEDTNPFKRAIDIATSLGYSVKESPNGKIVTFHSVPSQLTMKAKLVNLSGKDMVYWEAGGAYDTISVNKFPNFFKGLHQAHMHDIKKDKKGVTEDPMTGGLIGGALGLAAGARGAWHATKKGLKRGEKGPVSSDAREAGMWAKDFAQGIVDPRTYPGVKQALKTFKRKFFQNWGDGRGVTPQSIMRRAREMTTQEIIDALEFYDKHLYYYMSHKSPHILVNFQNRILQRELKRREQGEGEEHFESVSEGIGNVGPAPTNTDDILQGLTSAFRACRNHRDSYTNFKNIETVYDLLRDPLMKGDLEGYEKMHAYVSGKYPDAFDALMDELPEQGVAEGSDDDYDDGEDRLSGRHGLSADPKKMAVYYPNDPERTKIRTQMNVPNLKKAIKSNLGKHKKPNLPEQGVAKGPSGDLVYISVDRVEAFEDWMDSEGLETNVPKTDEGTYVVYDYSNADHISKMYASDWNEKKGVAEGAGPQVGDEVYYGSRLIGWFKGYSKLGKIITDPNVDEMGDEYLNKDAYWDPQDKITIKSKQGVAEGSEEKDPVWNKGTPMPKDYTCHCGLYVHPSRRNPKAIHTSDCPYAKKQDKEQGVAEGYKNTYEVGDRVNSPLGTGTITAVSKNVNVDGKVKVKLDDPSQAGEDGKHKDTFVLTTTQLTHISD